MAKSTRPRNAKRNPATPKNPSPDPETATPENLSESDAESLASGSSTVSGAADDDAVTPTEPESADDAEPKAAADSEAAAAGPDADSASPDDSGANAESSAPHDHTDPVTETPDDRSGTGDSESVGTDPGVAGASDGSPDADHLEVTMRPRPFVSPEEPAADSDSSEHSSDTKTPVAPAPVPVETARVSRGPGFLTLLLGGVLAGGIGYVAAEYDVFGQRDDALVTQLQSRIDDQSARIDQLAEQATNAATAAETATQTAAAAATEEDIAALRAEIESLAAAPEPVAPVEPTPATPAEPSPAAPAEPMATSRQLAELTARVDENGAALATLRDRVEELAGQIDPAATTSALDAYQKQLAALQQELDGQRAAIAEAKSAASEARTSAADETRRITVQAALAQIAAALENGAPFVDAVSDLGTAGGIDVPAGLGDHAASGVATLSALQRDFPPVARDALSVSIRETTGGGAMERFGAFLRAQTGARSLDARDGDDPDAVLSRAEAAVRSGDLQAALDEIAALPEAGQAAMSDWTARARARLEATSALADLSAATNPN